MTGMTKILLITSLLGLLAYGAWTMGNAMDRMTARRDAALSQVLGQ